MKVLHICLASHFTEGLTYQDNILSEENVKDGHDVLVVSDCFKYIDGKLTKVSEENVILQNGVHLIRINYDYILNDFISSKIRKVNGLNRLILDFKPDIILFHGVAGWEMLTVAKYKKLNPFIKLYIDSHEDFNNSGTNFISYFFQYVIFNRLIVSSVKKYVNKFLFLTIESKEFLMKAYCLKNEEMEFYPLGGNILPDTEYIEKRENSRKKINVNFDNIVFLQTGKFDYQKKLIETVKLFSLTKNNNYKYVIAGMLPEEMNKELSELIKLDSRIQYLGWVNSEELEILLCAADVYVQPGSQSATMQMSLCARCAVILHDFPSHRHIFSDNGWLVKTDDELKNVFLSIDNNPEQIHEMSKKSYEFAKEYLDYTKLAKRILL